MPADLTKVPSAHKNRNPQAQAPAPTSTTTQGASTRGHGAPNFRVGASHAINHGRLRIPSWGARR